MRLLTALTLLVFFCGPVQAQEVLDLQYKSAAESSAAAVTKTQLFDKAVVALTMENIKSMIGEEKADRNKSLIENKIVKDSNRYVLSIRGDNYQKNGDKYTMDVALKFSLKNLRALLLENGLLYQLEGPPKVLSVVQFIDRVGGRSFGWWYPNATKAHVWLKDRSMTFDKILKEDLRKIGFFGYSPNESKLSQSLPDAFRGEALQKSDYLFLGEFLKSSIVLRGQILFRSHSTVENMFVIDMRLEALHSGNGRLLGEVVRTYETDPGQFQQTVGRTFSEVAPKITADLTSQLEEAWKRGTFGASLLQLAVSGHLNPKDLEDFKKTLVMQVRDIKNLKERKLQARRTTFEVDSSALPQELAQRLKAQKFARFKVEVEEVTASGLEISVEIVR